MLVVASCLRTIDMRAVARRVRTKQKDRTMGDLIFWTIVFVAFFLGFRWLQSRKGPKD